jgi:hypothetical protein
MTFATTGIRADERAGGDELEQQVGDAECREEGIELARITDRVRDDDQAQPAEDARDQERARDDETGAGQRPGGRRHAEPVRRARGCASR